jgi:iron complex outermembrane recepter protein
MSQPAAPSADDIGNLSLSDLANTNVTSVARKPQRLSQAAAAVFVITRDDIRRSGAVSLPEVLRLAPGVQVARINQSEWAITARGFNGRFANKLLVLVDGRTVYSPLFSGVYWESLDLPLENIERIEVIRGPGATMWGSNAVNGVINILTRAPVDTQGTSLSLTAGDADKVATAGRYGGKMGDHGYFRVNARFYDRSVDSNLPWGNQWTDSQAGFRGDWNPSSRDSFTLTGDALRAEVHSAYSPVVTRLNASPAPLDLDYAAATENLVGRWERKLTESTGLALQVSYTREDRSEVDQTGKRDTFDADFQYRMGLGSRQDIVWGFDARTTADQLTGDLNITFIPQRLRENLASGFLQDEISLISGTLQLVLGTKLEHNSYMTRPELEPAAQLIWTPSAVHTVWTSVARAVRAPARVDETVQIVADTVHSLVTPVLTPNQNFAPETLIAYEVGYRFQRNRVSFDISGFLNRYNQLRSTEQGTPVFTSVAGAPPPVIPLAFANNIYGEGRGGEFSGGYELTESVRFLATYSFLDLSLLRRPGSNDPNYLIPDGEAPRHQGRLTGYWNLTRRISWDTSLYLVDRLPAQHVAGYGSIVSHLGWQLRKGVDAVITADNLLDHRHFEFIPVLFRAGHTSDVLGRTVRANITWRF